MNQPILRRRFMEIALAVPVLAWAGAVKADQACVDLSALSDSDRALRTSLKFQLVSDDPKQVCGCCSFFTAGQSGCGACSILNGPTTDKSRCDSWAAKS